MKLRYLLITAITFLCCSESKHSKLDFSDDTEWVTLSQSKKFNSAKAKKLYDAITAKGLNVGDEQGFLEGIKDENRRKKLFDAVSAKGYKLADSYNDFSARLGFDSIPSVSLKFLSSKQLIITHRDENKIEHFSYVYDKSVLKMFREAGNKKLLYLFGLIDRDTMTITESSTGKIIYVLIKK
jgi:hypothetical protein